MSLSVSKPFDYWISDNLYSLFIFFFDIFGKTNFITKSGISTETADF